MFASQETREKKNPRRRRRYFFRFVLPAVVVGLGLLVALAPSLVPESVLKGHLERRLAETTQTNARVDRVQFGWLDGFSLSGLELTFEPTQSRLRIDRLHIPSEPGRWILGRVHSFIRLDRVRMEWSQDQPLPSELFKPAGVPAERIQIGDLAVELIGPDGFRNRLEVPSLELVTDSKNQRTSFYSQSRLTFTPPGQPAANAGQITTRGEFTLVRQNGQQCLAGNVRVNWADVDLCGIRAERIPSLDLTGLHGLANGSLVFNVNPDLHFRWNLDTEFRDLQIRRRGATEPTRIETLKLVTKGSHDPVAGNLNLEALDIRSSALDLSSKITARVDDTGLSVDRMDVSGNFNSAAVPQLAPGIQTFLGPQARIGGPCRFEFRWTGKSPTYTLEAEVNADRVAVTDSALCAKQAGSPLRWNLAIRADQSNWPWMNLNRFDLLFADLSIHGSGRLPRLQPTDDFNWWLDNVRRLGQIELTAQTDRFEAVTGRLKALQAAAPNLTVAGPVSVRVGYTGQEDVGRTDLELELAEKTALAWKDYIVKPAGEKINLNVQGFWPWQSQRPEAWFYFFGQLGQSEIMIPDRPARITWAFSQRPNEPATVDLVGSLAAELHGLEHLLAWSPRLRHDGWPDRLKGGAELKVDDAVQIAITPDDWTLRQARLRMDLQADRLAVNLPDTFVKPNQVPLAWTLDYKFHPQRRSHELTSGLKWQDTASTLRLTRSGNADHRITGRYELQVDDLQKTFAAFPGLARKLNSRVIPMGKLAAACQWSSDPQTDTIEWQLDGTGAGLVVDGREFKLPGVPAVVSGALTLPKPEDPDSQVYTISKLQSRLGESFLNLNHGTFKLHRRSDQRWLRALGMEPWMAWRNSPVDSLALHMTGRMDVDGGITSIHPIMDRAVQTYGLSGWTDFEAQAQFQNSQFSARIVGQLDNLGVWYKDVLTKARQVPGSIDLKLWAWPDNDDPLAYHCQVMPLTLRLGPVQAAARADGRFQWRNHRRLELTDGQAQITLDPINLSEMPSISGLAARHQTSGTISGRFNLSRDSAGGHVAGSVLTFDQVRARLDDLPIGLDGTVNFSSNYCFADRVKLTAGGSGLEASWQTYTAGGGLGGTVDIYSDYTDSDQLRSIVERTIQEFSPNTAMLPATTTQASPADQEAIMAAAQPYLRAAAGSDLLVTVGIKSFRTTDPRSGVQYHLNNFLSQLNLGKSIPAGKPEGNLKFWSRLSNGFISGDFTADLTQPNPPMVLLSTIDGVPMQPAMKPLVEDFFPGLTTNTLQTITERSTCRMFTTPQTAPNYQTGEGKMVFLDGQLAGKAAPDWVAQTIGQIFPGLDFARYNFDRMHNWFVKKPNGIVHNNMIFLGSPWNIYIEGDSRPGGFIEYEVGVDLLARYESEYWSSIGQGRIPVFTTTAKIVNGKMTNQVIKYVPTHELAFRVFVKNNAITGAYRLLRKQLDGKP